MVPQNFPKSTKLSVKHHFSNSKNIPKPKLEKAPQLGPPQVLYIGLSFNVGLIIPHTDLKCYTW